MKTGHTQVINDDAIPPHAIPARQVDLTRGGRNL